MDTPDQPQSASNGTTAPKPDTSLISYPCQFPIKVMGVQSEYLVSAVARVARLFDPDFDIDTIEERISRGGKYLGLTIVVTATSRQQLDDLYQALFDHPLVKVVI